MITVWSVCVGDKYHPGYVYALKEMVEKNLTIPHTFKCITTHKLPGVITVLPFVPYQGWWSKFSLFAPTIATGPSIYLDLDVIITGNIDYLADYTDTFSAPANWARSGHGGIQSSVMCWPGNWTLPYDAIKPLWPGKVTEDGYRVLNGFKYWGDQEFLWELLGDDWQRIPNVGSYKYHCRSEIPDWLKIMVFHGLPNPDEVTDPWILSFTAPLIQYINSSTPHGSMKGLKSTA